MKEVTLKGTDWSRSDVYDALDTERDYQYKMWGGKPHDGNKSVGDFIVYMDTYLQKAKAQYSTDDNNEPTLDQLRKVVALGIACFEVHGVNRRRQNVNS